MQGSIKIRIGAAVDRSVSAVFDDIANRSKVAARVVERNLNRGMSAGTGTGGPYRSRVKQGADQDAKAVEDSAKRQIKAIQQASRAQQQAYRAAEREARRSQRAQEREQERANRHMAAGFKQLANVAARETQRQYQSQIRERERFARRTSYRATRFLFPPPSGILGSARSLGSDMLRGAGIDFNFGGMVGRNTELERRAVALSNQGYQPGQGIARIAPEALRAGARTTAMKYGLSSADVLSGHERFTGITGNLGLSQDMMDDVAKLSAATGTAIEDMADLAGNLATQIKDADPKARRQKIVAAMRLLAGQGLAGAVDIKPLAGHMGGLTAAAPMFSGPVDKTMGQLGALVQIARDTGGAGTPMEAIRGVERFVGTFKSGARLKEFQKKGISPYGADGKLIDMFSLIKQSLVATGGKVPEMDKLFKGIMPSRGVQGLATTYNAAGGGAAGLKAVDAYLEKFSTKAGLSAGEVEDKAGAASQTTAAKAARFQENLDMIAEKMATSLLPSLEKLAPQALKVTEAFAGLIDAAAKHPFGAVAVAIAAAIGRAGIESAARAALERTIMGIGKGGGLTIGALAVTATAGVEIINTLFDESQRRQRNDVANDLTLFNAEQHGKKGAVSKAEYNAVQNVRGDLANRVAGVQSNFGSATDAYLYPFKAIGGLLSGKSFSAVAQPAMDLQNVGQLRSELARANGLLNGTLKVQVMNPEDIKSPPTGVDPSGRTPAPGTKK